MTTVANINEIKGLVARGAIFYIGHSGGKDSQAMYHAVTRVVPPHQVKVVHADLGDLEHADVFEHIKDTTHHQIIVARAQDKAGKHIDLFDMIRNRRASLDAKGKYDAPAFPSSAARFCTSDLKTGPIWREIRQDGDHPIVVNCVGIRGDESASRAKKIAQRGTLNINRKNTNSVREAYDWWPIAHWSDNDVWHEIVNVAFQDPHPAYRLTWRTDGKQAVDFFTQGNDRLSCQFCIFGSKGDLKRARAANPDLYKRYIDLEIEVRTTMFAGESLAERTQ